MEVLGMEIRKSGNVNNLYSDVDNILSKIDIQAGEINLDVQKQGVATALQKMMKSGGWLCICTIERCCKLCGLHISSERLALYQTLHCVHWSEMLPDFRTTLTAMILDDFRPILNPNS